jgi:hypothetical protein
MLKKTERSIRDGARPGARFPGLVEQILAAED